MRLRSSSPTSKLRSRRGVSLSEVVIASFLVVLVIGGIASTLTCAARLEQSVTLQGDTSNNAATAMNRITLDVREAKEVQELSAAQFRIYRPVADATGRYDR